jgi:hypothetical protein
MPSSVASVFAAAGLIPAGVVRWGDRIPASRPGIYAVALTRRIDSVAEARRELPLSMTAVDELLRARPELRVDGARPTREELAVRLAALWLGDEVIVYIGLAGTSLQSRVAAYYRTPLGARRPHAGGWPLKTLQGLPELWVHFAASQDPKGAEHLMLGAFQIGVSVSDRAALHDPTMPIPFANLERSKGQRQHHGITGAREPAAAQATSDDPLTPRAPAAAAPRQRAQCPASAQLVTHAGGLRSQRVTEKDIEAGRIRFPSPAKRAFPPERAEVEVELRGHRLTARWHPHYDRDQERSGVLSIGRQLLAGRVNPDEMLAVVERGGCILLS